MRTLELSKKVVTDDDFLAGTLLGVAIPAAAGIFVYLLGQFGTPLGTRWIVSLVLLSGLFISYSFLYHIVYYHPRLTKNKKAK